MANGENDVFIIRADWALLPQLEQTSSTKVVYMNAAIVTEKAQHFSSHCAILLASWGA